MPPRAQSYALLSSHSSSEWTEDYFFLNPLTGRGSFLHFGTSKNPEVPKTINSRTWETQEISELWKPVGYLKHSFNYEESIMVQ